MTHTTMTMKMRMKMNSTIWMLGVIIFGNSVEAFHLPSLPNVVFNLPSSSSSFRQGNSNELQLLQTIRNTGNGKNANRETQARVLSIVRQLEKDTPPSPTLLSNCIEAKTWLDGNWYLRYTAPSEINLEDGKNNITTMTTMDGNDKWVPVDASEGADNIETRKFNIAGSVSGGGIPVDASNTVALQSLDIDNARIQNVITTGIGIVTVGGTYSQSPASPLRAVVAFDTAKIELNIGPTIDISWLFDVRAFVKGSRNAGWLETTYISKNMRIGRGNKGSMFILTRECDDLF